MSPAPGGATAGDHDHDRMGGAIGWAAGAAMAYLALVFTTWGFLSLFLERDVVPEGHSRFMYPIATTVAILLVAILVGVPRYTGIRRDRAEPSRQFGAAIAGAGFVWLVFGAVVGLVAMIAPGPGDLGGALGTAVGLGLQDFAPVIPITAAPILLIARVLIARGPGASRA
ncbi:hypothetical protein JRG19_01410 [Pseudoclavibacter alba]|uniref:hypothetical protein n=1 Tax=Pseudoclavibacter albus TaxID=272241 RepID=UPI0019D15E02|nr:hypothetical protein [Pseudoclavibacter alba]MBN6777208.1 hypothetical protein [Pseudoclavibacter alba]